MFKPYSGSYHYHCDPNALFDDVPVGEGSPVIGFAADGFPIYGSYIVINRRALLERPPRAIRYGKAPEALAPIAIGEGTLTVFMNRTGNGPTLEISTNATA